MFCSVESNFCTLLQNFQSLSQDAKSSDDSLDRFKPLVKSVSSSWLNKIGSEDFGTKSLSFKLSCSSKLTSKFWWGTSGSSLKKVMGISPQQAISRSAERRFEKIRPLPQMFNTSFTDYMWSPWFVLITKLYAKIGMISFLNKLSYTISFIGYFELATNITKWIRTIFGRSRSWCHFLYVFIWYLNLK